MANALQTMIETMGLTPSFDFSPLNALGSSVVKHEDFMPFMLRVSGYTPESAEDALNSLNSGKIDRFDMTNQHAARMVAANILAACFVGSQYGFAPSPMDENWGDALFSNWEEKAPLMVKEQLRSLLLTAKATRDGEQQAGF